MLTLPWTKLSMISLLPVSGLVEPEHIGHVAVRILQLHHVWRAGGRREVLRLTSSRGQRHRGFLRLNNEGNTGRQKEKAQGAEHGPYLTTYEGQGQP